MKYPEITHLYKYRAFNIHSLSILINRKVWFANPNSFNDPFDCKIPYSHKLTPNEAVEYARRIGLTEDIIATILDTSGNIQDEFIQKWIEALNKSEEELKNIGVFTLSETNNNILLWAHYADAHRGFCIEFIRSRSNQLGDYNRTLRVQYKRDYPIINPTKKDVFELKYFTKSLDWAYEREWRLVNDQGNVEEPLSDIEMSSIIYGLEMPDSHKEIIKKVTRDIKEIKYRQAVIAENSFRLHIIDL
ncbi:MAG: hypothetical protein CVU61_14370 [Deltaproteobacteria bacterium HGW-Deltaproteobacteria-19]|jgi:hypothetical protein|nr:MAG: hypothetical protein CVU61_14370 [Deltaproteobacteria bacterium HGW-Deltaproteobacteria-19]